MRETAEIGKDVIATRSWSRKSRESQEVESASVDLYLCGNGINISAALTPEGAEKLADELREQAQLVRELLKK